MNSNVVRGWSSIDATPSAWAAGGPWATGQPESGVELDTTWRMLQAVGAAPAGMEEGVLRLPDLIPPEDLATLTQAARTLRPRAVPIEGPYGQGRLYASFAPGSAAAELLACDTVARRIGAAVGEELVSAREEGVELRVYTGGSGMDWHTDELLYAAPQYELVLTLWNSSDSRTEWRDAAGRTQGEWTAPGSALLVRAESAAHRVTPVSRGERVVVKAVYTPTLERPPSWEDDDDYYA